MARRNKNEHLVELAKRGAQAQFNDLLHELKLLVGMFPHLKDSYDRNNLPIPFLLKKGAAKADKAAKGTRDLSAKARRAISNAQKKRWALHRANAAKTAAKKEKG